MRGIDAERTIITTLFIKPRFTICVYHCSVFRGLSREARLLPFPLRFLFARQPAVMGKVLGIVYRAIATHLTRKAGCTNIVILSRFQ